MSRFPELPSSLPRRGNSFSKFAARMLLTLAGWRVAGEFPDQPKMVIIVAPHTTNWDFVVGILAVFALGLGVRYLGKDTLFRPPLGGLMRWLGGTPVVRHTPQGAVGDAAEMIAREDKVALAIAPEGTRTAGKAWRSGFYNIALAAKVPILPAAFDYPGKAVRLFPMFEPTGNYEADLARLQSCYAEIRRRDTRA